MKQLKKKILLYSIIIGFLSNSLAASTAILDAKFGAHAVGMGGAFTALAYGPDTIFHNWAYKSPHSYTKVMINQSSIQESPLMGIAIENPLQKRWLKLGLIYTGTSDLYYSTLNSSNQPTLSGSSFSQELYTFFSSISGQFLRTHFAARLGLFYESLENETANGYLIDLAIQRKLSIFSHPLQTALILKNPFGTKIKWSTDHEDTPPWILNLGLATTFEEESIKIGLDIEKENDIAAPRLFAGIEYWLYGTAASTPSFCVRAGYKNSDLTMGAGIKTRGWTINYSYNHINAIHSIDTSISDPEHRIAFGYHFGPEEKTIVVAKNSMKSTIFSTNNDTTSITIDGELHTINTSNLIPSIEVAQPIQTRLLSDTNFSINPAQNSISIQSNQLDENNPVNINISTDLSEKDSTVVSFPLKWIQKRTQSKDIIMFDIEKSPTAIILSGFIPEDIDLFINNQLIVNTENNNAFFEKYPIKENQIMVFDIMIIEKF